MNFLSVLRAVLVRRINVIACLTLLTTGCIYLPTFDDGEATVALPPGPDTTIARALDHGSLMLPRALLIQDPGLALSTRLHAIEAAETSIDLQYFIWQNDYTGILLIEKLLQAADRGVRVRALVDDIQLIGLIDRVSALNRHPNIEIRIYNPFSMRFRFPLAAFQIAEFAIDGNRLNHRMHNKLLVADNQLAILGGRNIGDDYFGYSDEWYFIDTDILVSGPMVTDMSGGFDVYWNSRWSYPVEAISRNSVITYELDEIRTRIHQRLAERQELAQLTTPSSMTDSLGQLINGYPLESTTLLVDDPNMSWFERPDEMAEQLAALTAEIRQEVIIATPYLVPTANLLDIAKALMGRGVKVTVLTNSLATNNHLSAHAAYAQFRGRLLDMGVEIYELRPDAQVGIDAGDAAITMHSKYILFDDELVFIGSMNLDPRSLYLNTELGVMLRSTALVTALRESFDELIRPVNAYHVKRGAKGIEWQADGEVLHEEPATGAWQRMVFGLMRMLPLSSQL